MIVALPTLALGQAADSTVRARITMERKGCPMVFSCPIYSLTLESDGTVEFEGKEHVRAKGAHKKKIEAAAVEELARRFETIHYFELPDRIISCTDTSLVVTSVSLGSQSHQVSHWECGSDPSLTVLEDEIDRISNSKLWIRGRLRLWSHWPWFHSRS